MLDLPEWVLSLVESEGFEGLCTGGIVDDVEFSPAFKGAVVHGSVWPLDEGGWRFDWERLISRTIVALALQDEGEIVSAEGALDEICLCFVNVSDGDGLKLTGKSSRDRLEVFDRILHMKERFIYFQSNGESV